MSGAKADFALRAINPKIGSDRVSGGEKLTSSYDLVEQMQFLFVRIVRVRNLPSTSRRGITYPFVEVKIGNYKATTKFMDNYPTAEWNQVFAFTSDLIQATAVQVTVRDKQLIVTENLIGKVTINLSDIPTCLPPDSAFAPQWYRLENRNGVNVGTGELMLSIWFGTQFNEVFPISWHLDAATVSGENLPNTHSNIYLSPKLWYLRVNIIQAQDLVPRNHTRKPQVYVKVRLGDVMLRTKVSSDTNVNPKWNEDLMFVAVEPFTDPLLFSVEDDMGNNIEECLGKCVIRLPDVEQRMLPLPAAPKWYNLEKFGPTDDGPIKRELRFASKLNMRISLDGGYHVLDESIHYASDFRSTMKKLWPAMLGVLELGIIRATGLQPMKLRNERETTDAYCVAKYGSKWVKTRTVVDSFAPKWNEQFSWEVYEPYTVFTIGVFDNCHLQGENELTKDPCIGKVRIRLSTLSTNTIYTYSYPLWLLHPNGVKKMGEIQLALRFTVSLSSTLNAYRTPLFPRMHLILPMSVFQLDNLRQQACRILRSRLGQAEPPLRNEVVDNMLNGDPQMWSLRKGRANFQRLMFSVSWISDGWKFFRRICEWKNYALTTFFIILYTILVFLPNLILPMVLFYCFCVGVLRWRSRRKHPPHIDLKLSLADSATSDEFDEEFDTFPSSRQPDVVRMRYDRLRGIGGRVTKQIGDMATKAERYHSLLSWEDPRITSTFLLVCLVALWILYMIPNFKFWILLCGLYVMRPPCLGVDIPNVPMNFISRLPTKADYML